ncbi:hypothetical protein [Clostridium perfringens]|uniref:hypothetical protein n=1 Tax=Clostridium perfringens TaxID=1502 RepID=UPI001CCE983D|nr:hypothetical protein [Clostridium perfringens]MCC2766259.1 hypothetical protein [Clostridium perfringens]MCG4543451.1 hypothetical protein [Clostridium perfringens]MCG4558011.1 hypothetical protein [Clostridium perfringens]MCG4561130.1 hypothetical protein [Clostridium perfringens]MCX0386959.1 hypothetical protein [Clostridium perfringens]
MEYSVSISEKNLLSTNILKSEFKKDFLSLKRLKKEIIKDILITSIISLVLIIFLAIRYKTTLGVEEIITLGIISWCGFSVITLFAVGIQMLSINKKYLNKYSYLINNFKIILDKNRIVLEANDILLNMNIKECTLIKDENILILCNTKGFKLIIPIDRIEFGERLESEIMGLLNGKDEKL